MCHYFEIIYGCGHSDVIEGPCEWRDEGTIDEHGKYHACTKSLSIEQDFERACIACSNQDLSNSDRSTERERNRNLSKERSTIGIIIRNEAWLRKRARRRNLVEPSTTPKFSAPSRYELKVQFHINAEFLARRHKRRCFHRHFDGHIHYQDFLEAVQAHMEAKAVLENTVPVRDTAQGTRCQSPQGDSRQGRHGSEEDTVQQAEISDPNHEVEQERSDVLSLSGGRSIDYREGGDSGSMSESEHFPWSLYPTRRWGNDIDLGDPQRQRKDQVGNFSDAVSAGDSQPNDTPIKPPYERPTSRRAISRESIKQSISPSTSSSNSSTESLESVETRLNRLPLDSPEGISRLAECRKFLGMSPNASPTKIYNSIVRDKVLRDSIFRGLIPRHHRPRISSRRAQQFAIETSPCLVMKIENDKDWQTRESFVHAWNSLDWPRHPAYNDGWLDEVKEQDSASPVAPILLDMTIPVSKQFINFAGVQNRPPHLPQVFSPLRISHTYSERRTPASEESHFSDSSSTSSDSSDDLPQNYTFAPEHIRAGDEQTDDTDGQEKDAVGRGRSRNRHDESSFVPPNQHPVLIDSPYGQALLSGLCQCLSFPQSRDPYELSLFIDKNYELINAIKIGIVPYNKSKPQETRLLLKTEPDDKFALMRAEFFHALSAMDWDDIDMAPAPLKRKPVVKPSETLDWDDEAQAQGLRKRIALTPSAEIYLDRMKGFREHRVKEFSPLRWSYTAPESRSEGDKAETEIAQAQGLELRWTLYKAKPEPEQALRQNFQRHYDRDAADSDLDSDLDSDEKLEEELRRRGFCRVEADDAKRHVDQWSTSPFIRPGIEESWHAWL